MFKGILGMRITIIGREREICHKLSFKLRVSFYVLVSSKYIFLYYGNHIDTNIDVVVYIIELNSSVYLIISYNFGDLNSYLRVHVKLIFI